MSNDPEDLAPVRLQKSDEVGHMQIDRMDIRSRKPYILYVAVSESNLYVNQLNEYA
jgi:hypothetical protein